MSSLKDQLLGLGFKPAPKPQPPKPQPAKPRQGAARRDAARNKPTAPRGPRAREDIDLAKAYAIRAQKEKDERIAAEREKQEQARIRREARAALDVFLQGKALNVADAEHVRHFEYGGKIKRIYVTAEQLVALNAGALGVVQQGGRYLLVDADTLAQAQSIFADAVALRVDPAADSSNAAGSGDRDDVPEDLRW